MGKIVTSIDPGDQTIKVVVAEERTKDGVPRILAAVKHQSKGFHKGCVIDIEEAKDSINHCLGNAEHTIGQRIKRVYLAIDGAGLSSQLIDVSTLISRADFEINEYDIKHLVETAEQKMTDLRNRNILDIIPVSYKLDGKKIMGNPKGMKGSKLEAKILFISSLSNQYDDLVGAVESAGVSVSGVLPSPIAASLVTISRAQKYVGCVLVDIGAEVTKIAVFEDGVIHSIHTIELGSQDISNDIALGLKISLDEAEEIKQDQTSHMLAQKKLNEIIIARLSDIFELVDNHLKKLGKNELLPAGVVLTGGGSYISEIEQVASQYLNLPARIASPLFPQNMKEEEENSKDSDRIYIKDPTFSVAYGLALFGISPPKSSSLGGGSFAGKEIFSQINKAFKHFLP